MTGGTKMLSPFPGAAFDYSTLPADVATEARTIAAAVRDSMRRAIVEVGECLTRVKGRLPHGQFGKWLAAEFGLTERSAENYMAATALAAKYEIVSDLPATALYLLSAPSTPESVRETVISQLRAGRAVAPKEIREQITEARYIEQQEKRRTEEAAALARLSPRARKSRAQREAERELERSEREERYRLSDVATDQAAALLVASFPADQVTALRQLLRNCVSHKLAEAVLAKLGEKQ